jgi:hypothetical protein
VITRYRRRDGLLSIVDADEADGLPPMHLLEGGASGYPDARVFIWRKIDITQPPHKAGRHWRLVETKESEDDEWRDA